MLYSPWCYASDKWKMFGLSIFWEMLPSLGSLSSVIVAHMNKWTLVVVAGCGCFISIKKWITYIHNVVWTILKGILRPYCLLCLCKIYQLSLTNIPRALKKIIYIRGICNSDIIEVLEWLPLLGGKVLDSTELMLLSNMTLIEKKQGCSDYFTELQSQ